MFAFVARVVIAAPRRVLIGAVLVMIAAGIVAAPVTKSLTNGGLQDPDAQSTRATELLASEFGQGQMSLQLLVTAPQDVATGSGRTAVDDLVAALRADGRVKTVVSPWESADPVAAGLLARDGRSALVTVWLAGDESTAIAAVDALTNDVAGPRPGGVEVLAGGTAALNAEMLKQAFDDLLIAESIAIPICLLILLWAFGGVTASLIPLAVGGFAIVGSMAALRLLSEVTDVSAFALNVAAGLGFALGVDYSLLILSRYREERAGGAAPETAITNTLVAAGRTVGFSAVTVALSLSAMAVFPMPFLRSFAYGGVTVVALVFVAAVVIVPAAALVFRSRVESTAVRDRLRVVFRRSARTPGGLRDSGWYRWSKRVTHRPLVFAVAVTVPLIIVGLPFLDVRFGFPDDRILDESLPVRVVGDELRRNYTQDLANTMPVVLPDASAAPSGALNDYCVRLSSARGVVSVSCSSGVYAAGQKLPAPAPPGLTKGDAALVVIATDSTPFSPESAATLDAIHAVAPPAATTVLIGGSEQTNRDTVDGILSRAPVVLLVIAVVSFLLLFALTGSVVIPAKAILLNLLSLSATFGAMVWVFQEGHLGGLGTSPWGGLMATAPIYMFCVLFGLSMDYEVFVISRIREFWLASDRSREANTESVALGLASTGRVVTIAALIMATTFVALAASHVSTTRMYGVGLTLAILMDATVIRMILIPAYMGLLGRWNWWAPTWLRRWHADGPSAAEVSGRTTLGSRP